MRVCGKLVTSSFEQDRLANGMLTKHCLNSVKETAGDSSRWSKETVVNDPSW